MASEIRDPTVDTVAGADFMDIRTLRLRTARYLVADVAEAKTEITVEATVCKGAMVQTTPPPPTNTDRKLGAADITVAKEVSRYRRNNGLGGWGNIHEVSHWRPHKKVGSYISSHRP